MAKLFGQELTKAELMKRVGNLASLAGVTRIRQEGGRAGNLHSYEVINERMRFSVLADKCMDIGALYYDGMPLFFLAKPGQMNGLWYNDGVNAPRSISGGMMFTCGLNNVGPMQMLEDGRTLPQHGTIRNAPASLDGARCFWEGDDYVMELTGEMREGELFGENLVLRRTITTRLGDPAVHIHDQIENEGSEPAPLMLMYHCNAGFPLLDQDSQLVIDPIRTECRDEISENGRRAEPCTLFGSPVDGYAEQVFYHKLKPRNGRCSADMVNPKRRLSLRIDFDCRELPNLIHWKCRAPGAYVIGLEPSNCHPEGLLAERQRGTLRILAPGEIAETDLRIAVIADNAFDATYFHK